jgi:hypothetical protein
MHQNRTAWKAAVPCLLTALCLARGAEGDILFKDSFEQRLAALNTLVVWEDDADGNGFNDLRNRDQRLNADAAGEQRTPAVAVAANGDFVVAWADGPRLDGEFSVFIRGFRADGSERFPTLDVSGSAGPRPTPDIAMTPAGDFVVVWADDRDGNGFGQIRAKGYTASGSQRFSRSPVNNLDAGDQIDPVVAIADDGTFVVAWVDDQDNDKLYDISARRFNANGSPQLSQFFIRASRGLESQPALAMGPDGDFVVAWRDDNDLNFFGQIRATAFDANGTERFDNLTLNNVGRGDQYLPAVAMGPDGSFVATWIDRGEQVMVRAFQADGTPKFPDQVANPFRYTPHSLPDIDLADDGSFVVVWQFLGPTGLWRLRGQVFEPDGTASDDFLVEPGRLGDQRAPAVVIR